MPPIRVMIVEDSRVVRELLEHMIGRDPRLAVVAAVDSGERALEVLPRVAPDVISMDIRLPGMSGLQATQRIMTEQPTPIVVVSASVESQESQISMQALRAGALSIVEKPVDLSHHDFDALAARICNQLFLMSQVKVIRQRPPRASRAPGPPPVDSPALTLAFRVRMVPFRMLGIAASTGGPAALQTLLRSLGPDFPLPILLVQHIAGGFLEGFASWLDGVCPQHVCVARAGEAPRPGWVHVAPADVHLAFDRGQIRLDNGEPVSNQKPSGTVLFSSMARSLGPEALAVLLTGMGDDGALGLKHIREAGGYTLAEDESTAVVYGMPGVAVALGAVCESHPLPDLGPRLLKLIQEARERC